MKNTTFYSFTIGILFIVFISSCQQIDSSQKLEFDVNIFEAFKILRVGGANGAKGTRILLKVSNDNTIEINSLEFESIVSEVSVVKSIQDTVWLESYFYARNEDGGENENVEKKTEENQCILHYRKDGKDNSIKISPLTLKVDTVQWR